MLSSLRLAPRHAQRQVSCLGRSNGRPAGQRRHFISGLSEGFLDLAIALPFPPTFPTYTSTIILGATLIRVLVFPVSLWARRRTDKLTDIVIPEIERLKPTVAKTVFEQMRQDRVWGNKEHLQKVHRERCIAFLKDRRKELYKQHNCSPMPAIVAPILAQLPPFFLFSMVLRQASIEPTPFDSEPMLFLTSLAHPDPTFILPIAVGLVTLANVEANTWFRTAVSGRTEPRLLDAFMRGLSLVRICITATIPSSMAIYWLSSATFGLVQTWIIEAISRRRLTKGPAREGTE